MVPGQIELYAGALPHLAVYLNVPAGLFHKPVDLREAQSGALPDSLCRKKRFERLLDDILGHPLSGVGHEYADILARNEVGMH